MAFIVLVAGSKLPTKVLLGTGVSLHNLEWTFGKGKEGPAILARNVWLPYFLAVTPYPRVWPWPEGVQTKGG